MILDWGEEDLAGAEDLVGAGDLVGFCLTGFLAWVFL